MPIWTTMGTGAYAPGEMHYLWMPKTPPPAAAKKRLIIACHGHGGDAWQMAAEAYTAHLVRPLIEDGFAYLSIDAGGVAAWGGATALARIADAWAWAKSLSSLSSWIPTDKYIAMGFSMGGLTVLNDAHINASHVAGVFAIDPVVDLQAEHDGPNAGSWGPEIEAAHGGSQATLTTALPTYSPYQAAASSDTYAGMPVHVEYATNDTAAITATQLAFFARCPSVETVSLGAVGHTPIPVDPLGPLKFMRKIA